LLKILDPKLQNHKNCCAIDSFVDLRAIDCTNKTGKEEDSWKGSDGFIYGLHPKLQN
jgi:hypothetical protein